MQKSRHSEGQIVRILRETDRDTIGDVAKRNGVSEASIYAWPKSLMLWLLDLGSNQGPTD